MKVNEVNEKLKSFWNDFFEKLEPEAIKNEDIQIQNRLDELLKFIGDEAKSVLDIGTGSGYCLLVAKTLGKTIEYGLGIDPAKNAIDFAKKTCELSKIDTLDFKVGDHHLLEELEDESFDGIICSNVLDVIPEETSNEVIKHITRLLKPEGYLLLKFNFYLTEALIERLKMEKIAENSYAMNGVLRGVNHTSKEWIDKFAGYEVMEESEYERVKNGPKDRIILLKKL